MLPQVVRWNAEHVGDRYRRLMDAAGGEPAGDASARAAADRLAARLEELRRAGRLPERLRDLAVTREELPLLAEEAAQQWTGTFNPRPFDAAGALELYERAY